MYLAAALGDPLRDFFHRYQKSAAMILALICLYRVSDFVLNIMNPFYLDAGFSLVEVAEVRKVFGVAASMVGVFAGGVAGGTTGIDAVPDHRRFRRTSQQPDLYLARDSGSQRAGTVYRDRSR
jgi:hypothetical protein